MICSKGHKMEYIKKDDSTSPGSGGYHICRECFNKIIDNIEPAVKSPSDKMIRSEDLRRKKYGREK